MKVELLYGFLKILPQRMFIKDIIPIVMQEDTYLEQFLMISPFSFSLSSIKNDEYINSLFSLFLENRERGIALLTVIYKWWLKKKAMEFQQLCNEQLYIFSFSIYEKENSDSVLFFSCLFSGCIDEYFKYKNDDKEVLLFPSGQLSDLCEATEKIKQLEMEIARVKDESITKRKQIEDELQKKYNRLQNELNHLKFLNDELMSKNSTLDIELRRVKGKLLLSQKQVVVIGTQWRDEILEKLRKEFSLKKIQCFLSTEKYNKLDSLMDSDFVIFSSLQSSHTAYYKVKKQCKNIFHTDKTNYENVFEEFLYWLGGLVND
ncbi:hypothetical protein [Anoxybacillus ayderensis]|uniref:hypothetical protein n=1 Tax=Anoxybacillus ayderensis TaxID=265546 RepID=UPI000A26D6AA|nr:hypothetical protein [Anoxybacillus ayderensis]OSX53223.1 hypothetical protein B7H16_12750 [Anoxybacillus ayderensis]